MSDLIKCPACHGAKTVLSFGCMRKKCDKCMGVGYCNAPTVQAPVVSQHKSEGVSLPHISSVNLPPRRGRPPKIAQASA